MSREAVHIVVRGRVQGVYFRATTQSTAQALGLFGWVRNLSDGSVELHAEGERANLDRLIAWCHEGPPAASVTSVEVEPATPEGTDRFSVR